jgi:hypothetical protein
MGNAYEAEAAADSNARAEVEYQNSLQVQSPKELLMLAPSTATSINVFSDGIIEAIKCGELNPLDVAIQLKAMELASDRIRKETKVELLNEVSKYPESKFTYNGNTITKAEHGTKYDFSKCGDTMLIDLEAKLAELQKEVDDRKTFLKAIKAPLEVFNSITGEVSFIVPPTKTSQSGINISIK